MTRNILLILISITLVFSAVSCNKTKEEQNKPSVSSDIDSSTEPFTADTLADKLKEAIASSDTLEKIEEEKISFIYNDLPDNVKAAVYSSPDATATEIAVFDVSNIDNYEAVENTVRKHIENQISIFKSYNPDEVKKLENAFIKKSGDFIVMVTANSLDKVKELINNIK